MQIETTRFGSMEIDETALITFPDGIPGFESYRQFALIPHRAGAVDKASPFLWLQSVENSALAFLLTDPRGFFLDYFPTLSEADRQALDLGEGVPDPRIYTLLTVPKGDPAGITANLLAPIAINPTTLCARQIIVNDDRYHLRHRIIPESKPVMMTAPRQIAQCAVG